MILYFSGTGNSKYVAKRIADALGDEIVNLNDRIKASDTGLSLGGHTARRRIPSCGQPEVVCAGHGSAAGEAGTCGNGEARYRQFQVRSDPDCIAARRTRHFSGVPYEQSQLDHSCAGRQRARRNDRAAVGREL